MENFDKVLNEAMANSSVENTPLNPEEIDIIKQALEIAEKNGKSFFTCLYELTEQAKDKDEKQGNKSR